MKKIIPVLLGCAFTVANLSPAFSAEPALDTEKKKISYSIGLQMGMQLSTLKDNIDISTVITGIQDGQSGAEPKLSETEIRTVLTAFQAKIQTQQQEAMQITASKNAKEAADFLDKNKAKKGIIVLDSGVQYKVITKGNGPSPKASDTVTVHYKGSLINGTEFDSSYKRGEPATFPLNGVIKGWTEALQLMQTGSKWQIFIPADSAYGPRGKGAVIEPNAMLIFEIELLEVKAAQ